MHDARKDSPVPLHTPHGHARCEALVEAAIQAIADGGFEKLTTRNVAARTGMNIATLHYYFATKEDLIEATLRRVVRELETPFLPGAGGNPLIELRDEFAATFERLKRRPEIYRLLVELHARSSHDPSSRRLLAAMTGSWNRNIAAYLSEGIKRGVFRADLDVEAAALGIMASVKGIVMECQNDASRIPVAERFAAEIERSIVASPPPSG